MKYKGEEVEKEEEVGKETKKKRCKKVCSDLF
jgi:hypothetical protein